MKATRRSFLAALACLPFAKRFLPRGPEMFQETTVYDFARSELAALTGLVDVERGVVPPGVSSATAIAFLQSKQPWPNRIITDLRDEDLR